MSLSEDLRALLVKAVQAAPTNKLGPLLLAMMEEGVVEDRRGEARPALPAPRKTKRRALRCPAPGCKNPFATRFGGWCADHRDTAGFKSWAKANAKKR